MMQKNKREKKIGNTLFIITTECSPEATETVEQKLTRILSRHVSGAEMLSDSYQDSAANSLIQGEIDGNMLPNINDKG